MDSKNLKDLCEAYGSIYEPEIELTEEQVWEEVENWVNSLIEEGYDLSEYSWEEMYESYLEEKDVVQLPGGKSVTTGRGYDATLGGQPGRLTYQRTPGSRNRVQRSFTPNPVLSKRNGVTGTGVGKDFKPQAWSSGASKRFEAQTVKSKQDASKSKLDAVVRDPNFKPNNLRPGTESPRPSGGTPSSRTATSIARGSGPTAATPRAKVAPSAPAGQTGDKAKDMDTWAKANPKLAAAKAERDRTRGTSSTTNPLMSGMKSRMSAPSTPSPTTATTALKTSASLGTPLSGAPNLSAAKVSPSANVIGKKDQKSLANSFEWGSTSKLVDDIANAYQSVYEAKKVDQDEDGDNDFADVRIARMIASGMSKEEAIRRVKDKSYNEETELDEATRMRKELGKEGETTVRKELAARSKGFKRSGSVDKTIAAAERGADNPYVSRGRNESESDHKARKMQKSQTLRKLAANRRKSVRGESGLRGYAAKVTGGDRDLQSARGSARSAGTLTPAERKQFGEDFDLWIDALIEEGYDLSEYTWNEMYEIYEETAKEKEERLATRRARVKELQSQGREMTSSRRAKQKADQRKEQQRHEKIERLGGDILNQIQGKSGKVSDKPMGSDGPVEKESAPEATRRLNKNLRRDTLGTAADQVLKQIRKEHIESWVKELIEEGYDLSTWSEEEIVDLYNRIFD
jgi:hypothetical protein